MVDTVKIRQLRPTLASAPRKGARTAAQEPVVLGRLDRVVEDVKLALLTTGLALESDKDKGRDPYNTRPAPKGGRDAWSDHKRRR